MAGAKARCIAPEEAFAFVWELLKTGLMLTDTLAQLLEDLDDNAFGDDDNGTVLIEMVAGTLTPTLNAAGREVVSELVMLLQAMQDRVLQDLEAALQLAKAREASDG